VEVEEEVVEMGSSFDNYRILYTLPLYRALYRVLYSVL
jgi:hypothetical protein